MIKYYNFGRVFSLPFVFLGGIFLLLSIAVIMESPAISLILAPIGLFMVTTTHGLQIDQENSKYRKCYSVAGIRWGNWIDYEQVEKVFINSATDTHKIYSRVNSGYTYSKQNFVSFLKFSDGTKVPVFEGKNKEILLTKVQKMADDLSTVVQDNTK